MANLSNRFLKNVATKLQTNGVDLTYRVKKINFNSSFTVTENVFNKSIDVSVDVDTLTSVTQITGSAGGVTTVNDLVPVYTASGLINSGSSVVVSCALDTDTHNRLSFVTILRNQTQNLAFVREDEWVVTYIDGNDPTIDYEVGTSNLNLSSSNGETQLTVDASTDNVVFCFTSATGSAHTYTIVGGAQRVYF
jgi:hypothetical protein